MASLGLEQMVMGAGGEVGRAVERGKETPPPRLKRTQRNRRKTEAQGLTLTTVNNFAP